MQNSTNASQIFIEKFNAILHSVLVNIQNSAAKNWISILWSTVTSICIIQDDNRIVKSKKLQTFILRIHNFTLFNQNCNGNLCVISHGVPKFSQKSLSHCLIWSYKYHDKTKHIAVVEVDSTSENPVLLLVSGQELDHNPGLLLVSGQELNHNLLLFLSLYFLLFPRVKFNEFLSSLLSSQCWIPASKFKTFNNPTVPSAGANKFADNSNQSEHRKYHVQQSIGWN